MPSSAKRAKIHVARDGSPSPQTPQAHGENRALHKAKSVWEAFGLVGLVLVIPTAGAPAVAGHYLHLSQVEDSWDLFRGTAPLTIAVMVTVFLYRIRFWTKATEVFFGAGILLLVGNAIGVALGSASVPSTELQKMVDSSPGISKAVAIFVAYLDWYGFWVFLCAVLLGACSGWIIARQD